MGLVKPINDKVSMFATNDEMYDQLTTKEISIMVNLSLVYF